MKDPLSTDLRLPGALAALQKRAVPQYVYDEFLGVPRLNFSLEKAVMPGPGPGRRNLLELRASTSWVMFPEMEGEALIEAERSAYLGMAHFLYEDVLAGLRGVMDAVGNGERQRALKLLSAMHARLSGYE